MELSNDNPIIQNPSEPSQKVSTVDSDIYLFLFYMWFFVRTNVLNLVFLGFWGFPKCLGFVSGGLRRVDVFKNDPPFCFCSKARNIYFPWVSLFFNYFSWFFSKFNASPHLTPPHPASICGPGWSAYFYCFKNADKFPFLIWHRGRRTLNKWFWVFDWGPTIGGLQSGSLQPGILQSPATGFGSPASWVVNNCCNNW